MTRSAMMKGRTPPNGGASWPDLQEARARVLEHQRKLHRWARTEPVRRFHDIFNLVCDPATLIVAWDRVAHNAGASTAGVDAVTRYHVERRGVDRFLEELRSSLKAGTRRPHPVRQTSIPKKSGKVRYLGIPTLGDRVVQMALKLVIEPIFEADFYSSSYGYRPGRRAQDAIAELHHITSRPSNYEWIIEGDIKACFDTVDHRILMDLVRERVADRKTLRLISAFLRAGVVEQHGGFAASLTGTPQGGIISPLLANIYLSILDRHFDRIWKQLSPPWRRQQARRRGQPTFRLIRYADDFIVAVHGSRQDAESLRAEIGELLATKLNMTLSAEKTLVTHIDRGFDFLGFHVRRKAHWRGRTGIVTTYPSKAALASVTRRIKQTTRRGTTSLQLADVLRVVNRTLRGWAAYFKYSASKTTFAYLGYYAWWRLIMWLRRKHPKMTWKQIRRRFYGTNRLP